MKLLRITGAFFLAFLPFLFYSAMADERPIGDPSDVRILVQDDLRQITLTWKAPESSTATAQPERYAVFWNCEHCDNGRGVASTTTSITLSFDVIADAGPLDGRLFKFGIRSDNDTLRLYSGFDSVEAKLGRPLIIKRPIETMTAIIESATVIVETATAKVETATVVETHTSIIETITPVVLVSPSPTPAPSVEPTNNPTPSPAPTPAPQPQPSPLPAPVPPAVQPQPEPIVIPEPVAPKPPEPVVEPAPTPEPTPPVVEPQPKPAPEPAQQPAPEPQPEPQTEPQPVVMPEPAPISAPPIPVVEIAKANSPDQLPVDVPKVPESNLLTPHIQQDKPNVANGGIEFFGTKSQPQVIQEDGTLTPPPPAPMSGDPIPPDAITIPETFLGQPGGTTFNAPDIAVPVEPIDVNINIPGIGQAAQSIANAYVALANIGNDMSPITRKKAKKVLVATIIGGQILRKRIK